MLASMAALGLLPHVADALSGVTLPPLGNSLSPSASGCRVVEIVDGDTVTLACPGRPPERARLTGFDTPELFSPKCRDEKDSALRAKRHLGRVIGGAEHLGVVRQGHDRYGRVLVGLSVDGRPVATEMISAGLARAYDGGRRAGWCGGDAVRTAERGTTAKWVRVDG